MSEPDAWDADDFEPADPTAQAAESVTDVPGDRWSGEDEDEVKDSWEEEEVDVGKAVEVKKKKSLKERIAEKEAKKREEMEKKRQEVEANKSMAPEDRMADKLRRQKLQEEADLKLACDAFGVSMETVPRLDTFIAVTKEDFDTLEGLIKEKVTQFERSPYYVGFLENLYRDLAVSLDPEDLKKLGSAVNTLANEKTKAQKGTKAKKKKTTPKLMTGKADNDVYDGGDFGGGGEYDDFI